MKLKYIYPFAAILLLLATQFLTAGCDRNEDDITSSGQQQPDNTGNGNTDKSNALCIVTTKQPFADETGTRASTDFGGTYATTFETGDEIGVIAVKDGAVLDDCNNVKLTYNSAANTWTGDDIFYVNGATYIAYSPYRTVMDGKKSTQEIFDAFVVNPDQQSLAKYTANDLMIDDSGMVDRVTKSLTFSFTHRMAMLEIPKKYIGMHARTTTGWVYPIKSGYLTSALKVNDVQGFYLKNNVAGHPTKTSYLYLFKPVTDAKLEIVYRVSNRLGTSVDIPYTTTGNTFVAGQRRVIFPTRTRDIKIGDFYYDNGSIFPGDLTISNNPYQIYDGCIGVVFFAGVIGNVTGKESFSDYAGSALTAIHGYVAALDNAAGNANVQWGSKTWKISAWGFGYFNTQQIKSGNARPYNQSNFPACWAACNYSVTTPSMSTGWYFPCQTQLWAIYTNRAMLEAKMKAAGGTTVLYNACWSSSESGTITSKDEAYYARTSDNKVVIGQKDAIACVRSVLTF